MIVLAEEGDIQVIGLEINQDKTEILTQFREKFP